MNNRGGVTPGSPNPPQHQQSPAPITALLGTINRRRIKNKEEVDRLDEEGRQALAQAATSSSWAGFSSRDQQGQHLPDGFYQELREGEQRSLVLPPSEEEDSRACQRLRRLVDTLLDWLNSELADERILVRDLFLDLSDGQVLQKLAEKLLRIKIDYQELTQSAASQRQRLRVVLGHLDAALVTRDAGHYGGAQLQAEGGRWSVEAIHSGDQAAILHLLVALSGRFAAHLRLPPGVQLKRVVVVGCKGGLLKHTTLVEHITCMESSSSVGPVNAHPGQERGDKEVGDPLSGLGSGYSLGSAVITGGGRGHGAGLGGPVPVPDLIDTLFLTNEQNVAVLEQALYKFVNLHLTPLDFEVNDLYSQFSDGVLLIILLGCLGRGFFVPLHLYHSVPCNEQQRAANVSLAFELMESLGILRPIDAPLDIVAGDRKAVIRVLFHIFHRFK